MANKNVSLGSRERELLIAALQTARLMLERGNVPGHEEKIRDYGNLEKKIDKAGRTIKIASAKGKARNLQQWVADRISAITGIPYIPGNDESLIRSREMGQAGVDVVLIGEAAKLFPFAVECKSTETVKLMEQIEDAMDGGKKVARPWLLVIRNKRIHAQVQTPIVVMSWETFETEIYSKTGKVKP